MHPFNVNPKAIDVCRTQKRLMGLFRSVFTFARVYIKRSTTCEHHMLLTLTHSDQQRANIYGATAKATPGGRTEALHICRVFFSCSPHVTAPASTRSRTCERATSRFCVSCAGGAANDSNSSKEHRRESCLTSVHIKPESPTRHAEFFRLLYLSNDVASPFLPPHLAPGVRRYSSITLRLGGAFCADKAGMPSEARRGFARAARRWMYLRRPPGLRRCRCLRRCLRR